MWLSDTQEEGVGVANKLLTLIQTEYGRYRTGEDTDDIELNGLTGGAQLLLQK